MRSQTDIDRRWRAAIGLWLVVVLSGLGWLWKYKTTPAPVGATPLVWPAASALQRAGARPTVILFAHPQCPCTRASLEEFNQVVQPFGDHVSLQIVFARPAAAAADFTHSSLWDRAHAVVGARVLEDRDGVEAKRFGATASGHVVAFDEQGRLLFSGGITSARGHNGDNLGRARLTALLQGKRVDGNHAPVFGCLLSASEMASTVDSKRGGQR